MKIVHIAGHTDTGLVAATVAALVRAGEPVELQAMGPAAAGNALHAVVQANRWLGPAGLRLAVSARYERLAINGSPQTAIRMPVAARPGQADSTEATAAAAEVANLLLVSATSDPGHVAGAMAGCVRGDACPVLQAIGTEATYAAVKALAIAGRYLADEGLALAAEPQLVDVELQGAVKQAVRLRITAHHAPAGARPNRAAGEQQLLLVAAGSLPGDVCGAIAGHVRDGRRVELQALGPDAALLAVRALIAAAGHLAGDGIGIATAPYAVELQFHRAQKTALRLPVTACPVTADDRREMPATAPQPIRAAASSAPSAVAGAIANRIRAGERVEVRATGAEAVCIALRAIVTARRYLAGDAIAIATIPGSVTETRAGAAVSALCFPIVPWSAAQDARADD
jgi:stage V sporulation protein SpoVS